MPFNSAFRPQSRPFSITPSLEVPTSQIIQAANFKTLMLRVSQVHTDFSGDFRMENFNLEYYETCSTKFKSYIFQTLLTT